MPHPTPSALRFGTAALLLGLSLRLSAEPAASRPPCDGDYKPEYKAQWDLTERQWKDLCRRPAAQTASSRRQPASTTAAPAPAGPNEKISGSAAAGAERALQRGGGLNLLFDRSLSRGELSTPVTAAGGGARQSPVNGAAAPTRLDARAPAAIQADRIDQKEVAKHFKFEPPDSWLSRLPGPLGWLGGAIDSLIVKPIRGAFFCGPEKAYVRAMTDKLQESEEGRKIMRGVIAEGVVVKIQPESFAGSRVDKRGELEELHGVRGMADTDSNVYTFNRLFMKMQDKESGLESASSNMGHELNHVLLHTRVAKRLPEYDDVLNYALVDEQSARLKGYVVAWQLNRGKPNGYIQDGKEVADNPEDFWERMKSWSPAYERSLDLEEMKDPVRSYQARAERIKKEADESDQLAPGYDFTLRRIDHLGSAHRFAEALKELRAQIQGQKDSVPEEIKEIRESQAIVNERIAYLQSAKGKPFLEKMQKAASDPRFIQLFHDMEADLEKLRSYKQTKPVPKPKPTPGALNWGAFEMKWDELHIDAPGQDPPWKERDASPA